MQCCAFIAQCCSFVLLIIHVFLEYQRRKIKLTNRIIAGAKKKQTKPVLVTWYSPSIMSIWMMLSLSSGSCSNIPRMSQIENRFGIPGSGSEHLQFVIATL